MDRFILQDQHFDGAPGILVKRYALPSADDLLMKGATLEIDTPDPLLAKASGDGDMLKIKGLGCAYGNADDQGDIIEYGAFSESIAEIKKTRKGKLPIYWNHNWMQAVPIGVWDSVVETEEGIKVSGEIDPQGGEGGVSGAAVIRAIKSGAVASLSITGGIQKRRYETRGENDMPIRVIEKAELREISVVWHGANRRCRVTTKQTDDGENEKHIAIIADAFKEMSEKIEKVAKK